MLAGLNRFSAFSRLIVRSRKARSPFRILNAQDSRSPFSSIAEAMLGRAVHKYQPPPAKKDKAMGLPTPSPSTKAINDKKINLCGQPSRGTPMLPYQGKLGYAEKSANPLKRTLSGLVATLNSGSFQDETDSRDHHGSIDYSRSSTFHGDSHAVIGTVCEGLSSASKSPVFEFDPDEFDNDSDLDFDIEYPQPLPPQSVSRKPLHHVSPNPLQASQLDASLEFITTEVSTQASDAVPWSSSPSAHKQTPPGAFLRTQSAVVTIPAPFISAESLIDANPRPAKRRTVPWLQRRAEQKEVVEATKTTSSPAAIVCFKCQKPGHTQAECVNEPKCTPQAKKKHPPWNTTASAVKAHQKQKKLAKQNSVSEEFMRGAIHAGKTSEAKQAPVFLSEEQKEVLNLVTIKKKSVFFTGSAGTGKSVLMKAIISDLRRQYIREPDRVAVTASTGLAACNIGGVTLHSFGGIGLGKEEVPELVKKINRNQKAKQRWMRTKTLIIDEISMVDGALFDKLESIARMIRKNGRPFGGIQLVITGDFFQLPPVPDFGNRQVKFAFDAGTWSTAINHTIGLTEVFRQKDPVFANMLNEMRLGEITDATVKAFRRLDRPIKYEDALEATELFPTRAEVEKSNQNKMQSLQGKLYVFPATDGGSMKDVAARDKLLANCIAPPVIELKKGAQVMLIKNIDENLVNGSLGRVIAFMNDYTFDIYVSNDKNGHGEDDELTDAFSEARAKLKSMVNKDLVPDTSKEYPLVRFSIADGTTRHLLCQPEDWKVELPNGEVQAQRRQLPLILAWALSIHKAQGQTLERVKVDLRKVFENGQAYVALSRATCQDGLQVSGFDKKKVTAHPRVGEFYNTLYSVNKTLKHPKVAPKPAATNTNPYEKESVAGREQRQSFNHGEEEAMASYG